MAAPIEPPAERKTISVVGAAFLGLGAMVGAGIFALLGQAGAIAGSAVWLSFAIAGLIALLLGYAVAKLGVRYPSSGGLDRLPDGGLRARACHRGRLLALLLRRLIVTAMVAVSFGSYGRRCSSARTPPACWVNVLTSAVVRRVVAINSSARASSTGCSRRSSFVLLAVFALFIVVTLADVDWDLLAPSTYPSRPTSCRAWR